MLTAHCAHYIPYNNELVPTESMEDSSPGPKKMRILCDNCCARMLVSGESAAVLLAICPLIM